jgi:RNA polymerase sigma-70 factor (ECF subfamily)
MNLLDIFSLPYDIRALYNKGGNALDRISLIERCQLGDLESFEQLYKSYCRNALGTAYLIAKHKGIAEEIVQEAFFQCYKNIKKLRDPAAFDVWFYKLLVRLAWKMASDYEYSKPLEEAGEEYTLSMKDFSTVYDREENKLIVHEAIDKLSSPLKTVIILYYFNDLTIKQISMVLDCFQGTVKSRLHNAKKCLEKELKKSFGEHFINTMYLEKECETNG